MSSLELIDMSTHPPEPSFMGLASELRLEIFEYLLPSKIEYNGMFDSRYERFSIKNTSTLSGEETPGQSHDERFWTFSPASEAWESTYFAILRINRQCSIEASRTLYKRTLSISMDTDLYFYKKTFELQIPDRHPYANPRFAKSYIGLWNQSWMPQFSALRTLELIISPRNTPESVYWNAIRSSMTLFFDHYLEKLPQNLIIKLFDMARGNDDPWTYDPDRIISHDLIRNSATFEDYMETLGIFQRVALKAENCQFFLPYWMEHKFQTTALKTAWDASSGVKVCFMPLGAWPYPKEYVKIMDSPLWLPQSAYKTPINGVPQNERSWSDLAWEPNKEPPEENFEESRVRAGYFFLADLAEDAQ